jgi:hypothetical protein
MTALSLRGRTRDARGSVMIPVLIGVGATVGLVASGWLLITLGGRLRLKRRQLAERRRLAPRRAAAALPAPPVDAEWDVAVVRDPSPSLAEARDQADAILAKAEQEALDIVTMTRDAQQQVLDSTRLSASLEASALIEDARRMAASIIGDAERRAADIVVAAEGQPALAEEKRNELSTLLLNLLGEVRRTSSDGPSKVLQLREADETRSSLADTAE